MSVVVETMQRWIEGEPVWPYTKIIDVWGSDFAPRHWLYQRDRDFDVHRVVDHFMKIHMLRDKWITQYGFAIPCAELLDALAMSRIVIEIGAGSGYMTKLMRHRHINVVGTDSAHNGYTFERASYDPAQIVLPGKTAVRRFDQADTVFCSWPTYGATWFKQALKAMKIGQRMIVIREDACAESGAWDYFDACFGDDITIAIPSFPHMNDYADVRVKKRQQHPKIDQDVF